MFTIEFKNILKYKIKETAVSNLIPNNKVGDNDK